MKQDSARKDEVKREVRDHFEKNMKRKEEAWTTGTVS